MPNLVTLLLRNIFSEPLRLLEAVEQYGYGNWEDIIRKLNNTGSSETGPSTNWSKKIALQAKDEFCEVFLNSTIGKTFINGRLYRCSIIINYNSRVVM